MVKAILLNDVLAKEYKESQMEEIEFFQHYKTNKDWKQVKDVLWKKPQRPSGHPTCAIIGEQQITGTWFGTNLFKNRLPDLSPFGERRFLIECWKLFKPKETNLYFADFYCFPTKTCAHCAALVMCKKGSPADK